MGGVMISVPTPDAGVMLLRMVKTNKRMSAIVLANWVNLMALNNRPFASVIKECLVIIIINDILLKSSIILNIRIKCNS